MSTIRDRVAKALAKNAKEKAKAEQNTPERIAARRSFAAHTAAATRQMNREADLISGKVQPRNAREQAMLDRYEFGDFE
jgi:hypothetical protein